MIKVSVTRNVADAKLRALALQVRDRAPVNRRLSVQLQSHVFREFRDEGAFMGGAWAPLAESTQRRKVTKSGKRRGAHPILMVTGALRNSYQPFYTDRQAGVGSEVEFAPYHEEGGQHLPKRSVLPTDDQALNYAVKIYEHWIGELARRANA